jgi:NAD+ synthase (glutamine-hydrolysing)
VSRTTPSRHVRPATDFAAQDNMDANDFFRPLSHGFVRLAVGVPSVRVADPDYNAGQTIALYEQAARDGASLVLFPELGLAAYTCDDLFHQSALLRGCEAALGRIIDASRQRATVAVVGLPLRVDHALYNCAAVVQGGRLLGVVPKSYLPNYGEFYEARQFQPASHAAAREVSVAGVVAPFGTHLLFEAIDVPGFVLHIEICEDVWVPIPPSSLAALAGATVLANLSASNITIGKAEYRRALVATQSARCIAAYLYSSAGNGESSTDLAWDGQALIAENGALVRESERFCATSQLISTDIDLERLSHERMRQTSFGQSAARFRAEVEGFVRIPFALPLPQASLPLQHAIARFPYVPADARQRDARCGEVYDIQVQALAQRMQASGIRKLVIGISGGLDSTQALLVAAQAMDRIGEPRSHIIGVTMPGYATSTRTLDQALRLMRSVGCSARQVDIRPSCDQMLADIGHPAGRGEAVHDVTFENVQAGERTSHLFRIANFENALVVGTGDLSELALGWCTYGVGDHMSHYNVNASVPKTLIGHLVRWVADSGRLDGAGSAVLRDVLDTVVSPELVPGTEADETPSQSTEDRLGPYALHDFFLFNIVRYGYAPSKVAFLAWTAWRDREAGAWPEGPDVERNQYALAEVKRHLRTFVDRFFRTSQFKRSCVPNSPKVGSGGSLSPRGDWRAPSDGQAAVWLSDVDRIPDHDPVGSVIE